MKTNRSRESMSGRGALHRKGKKKVDAIKKAWYQPTTSKHSPVRPSVVVSFTKHYAYPSTNDTTLLSLNLVLRQFLPLGTFTHKHACPRCGLKNVVYAFTLKSTAFLVCTSTNLSSNTLCPLPANKLIEIRRARWRAEVSLATDENNWDGQATDWPDFFDPLRMDWCKKSER